MKEVFITGIGFAGPNGFGGGESLAACGLAGPTFKKWPRNDDATPGNAMIGQVEAYPKERYFTERQLRLVDRAMSMSVTAAGLALEDANIGEMQNRDDAATIMGTSRAEHSSCFRFSQPLFAGKPRSLNPAQFPPIARNVSCGQIAISFRLRGMSSVLCSGPISSAQAFARAYGFLRRGVSEMAVTGGFETLSKIALELSGELYKDNLKQERPSFFGHAPSLVIPAEGSCMLTLETEESMNRRGAAPYARVEGYIMGRAFGGGLSKAMKEAALRLLANGVRGNGKVGLLSSSASGGCQPHDIQELDFIGGVARLSRDDLPVTACRSFWGESEAAASAAQIAVAACGLRDGAAPPTWNAADETPPGVIASSAPQPLRHSSALVSFADRSGAFLLIKLAGA